MSRPRAPMISHVTIPAQRPAALARDREWPTPERPPSHWFERPDFMAPGTRLTIGDDGRVYGYVCAHGTTMRLASGRVFTAAPSPTGYRLAMQASVECDDGQLLACAVIGATGHGEDQSHYDDPTVAKAVVRFGDDRYGTWIAGAVVPDVTHADVVELRRCSLSGDWRHHDATALARLGAAAGTPAGYDLIGAALVNTPGLPLGVAVHEVTEPEPVTAAAVDPPRPPPTGFPMGSTMRRHEPRIPTTTVTLGDGTPLVLPGGGWELRADQRTAAITIGLSADALAERRLAELDATQPRLPVLAEL